MAMSVKVKFGIGVRDDGFVAAAGAVKLGY